MPPFKIMNFLQKFLPKSIARDTLIVLVGTTIANAMSFFFQLVMVRFLSAAEYGEMVVLISVISIFSLFFLNASGNITKFVAGLSAKKQEARISFLVRQYYKVSIVIGVLVFAVFFLLAGQIAAFFNIADSELVVITGAGIALNAVYAMAPAVLNGLQKFVKGIISAFLNFGTKLVIGVGLVVTGFGVGGAMQAVNIGFVVGIIVGAWFLRDWLRKPGQKFALKTSFSYSAVTLVGVLCLAVFNSIDIFLVKHFFEPQAAGEYSAALQVARIVFYLVSALSIVLLAKSSAAHEQKKQTKRLLNKVLLISGALVGIALVPYFLFPQIFVQVIFGGKYGHMTGVMALLGLAMGFYVLSNLLANYFISVHRKKFVWIMVAFTLAQVSALWAFHESLQQVAMIVLAGNAFLFGALYVYSFFDKKTEYWTETTEQA